MKGIWLIVLGMSLFAHTKSLRIFAIDCDVEARVRSAIEHSFEVFRHQLQKLMIGVDTVITSMDFVDDKISLLSEIHDDFRSKAAKLPALWEVNENFLRRLIASQKLHFVRGILNTCSSSERAFDFLPKRTGIVGPASYDSLEQIIVHLSRDWSPIGLSVRQTLYFEGILPFLKAHVPSMCSKQILVPGAGLGRLAMEIAARGYRVEANECSGSMLASIRTIAEEILPANISIRFYPQLLSILYDDWDFEARLNPSYFPALEDIDLLREWASSGSMSDSLVLQFGDFVEIYGLMEQGSRFDAVVTCFFIDTATDILQYLAVIRHVLRPNGMWINAGPLHYHKNSTIAYSYRQLVRVVQAFGFSVVSETSLKSSYSGDDFVSMNPTYYHIPLTAFRLNSADHAPSEKYCTDSQAVVAQPEQLFHSAANEAAAVAVPALVISDSDHDRADVLMGPGPMERSSGDRSFISPCDVTLVIQPDTGPTPACYAHFANEGGCVGDEKTVDMDAAGDAHITRSAPRSSSSLDSHEPATWIRPNFVLL